MSSQSQILTNADNHPTFSEMEIVYDLVFVLNINSKGWILEKICRVIEDHGDLNCAYVFSERNDRITTPLPKARAYFFAHYALAFTGLAKYPTVFAGDRFVWFTHPDPSKGISFDELSTMLNACTRVFVANSGHREMLNLLGVDAARISLPIGGADPEVFTPHDRGSGKVGFVGAYYPRKSPDKMLALVRSMPDVDFVLIGPAAQDIVNEGILWTNWSRFEELRSLPNFEYVEAAFDDFPRWYGTIDVYCSLSELEGGPIPILEAMMSNAIPVVTRTGFAADVIEHGRNGHIVDIDADVPQVAALIRQALADTETDIRATALGYTWEAFAREILAAMRPRVAIGEPISFGDGSAGGRLLRAGWHQPDGQAVWTAGKRAEIDLSLDGVEAGLYRISARVRAPRQAQGGGQEVSLELNRKKLGGARLGDDQPRRIGGLVSLDPGDGRHATLTLRSSQLSPMPGAPAGIGRSVGVKLSELTIAPIPFWEPTAPILFTQGAAGETYLESGWYTSESSGVWSDGTPAEVTLPLNGSFADVTELVVSGRVFVPEGMEPLGMVVLAQSADETVETRVEFEDNSAKSFRIALPPLERTLQLTFVRDRAYVPAQHGTSDPRTLGFSLRKISVASAETGEEV